MPATLYSTTNAFPILTGYSTRSFDSGLLLWQGTYITRDTSAPPFAEGDPIPEGNYGAIDGLFVHPAPVLKKSPGPLAEWTVTAYGRTNAAGFVQKKNIQKSFFVSDSSSYGYGYASRASMPEYTQKIVLPSASFPDFTFSSNEEILPISVGMYNYEQDVNVRESSIIYVPYLIWEDYVMAGPSQPLIYNGFSLTFLNWVFWSKLPRSSKRRHSSFLPIRTDSVNYGVFTEYITSFSTFYRIDFFTA